MLAFAERVRNLESMRYALVGDEKRTCRSARTNQQWRIKALAIGGAGRFSASQDGRVEFGGVAGDAMRRHAPPAVVGTGGGTGRAAASRPGRW